MLPPDHPQPEPAASLGRLTPATPLTPASAASALAPTRGEQAVAGPVHSGPTHVDAARRASLALGAAGAGIVAALWTANRGLGAAAAALPPAGAAALDRYRAGTWLCGAAALGALGTGLVYGARTRRRAVARAAELERLSAELIRANRAKSEFLANVSHELRTPLNAVVGFAELMQDGVYGPLAAQQVSPVQRIASSATHLRHIVDQILDLARIAAGRLEVHTESFALRTFALEVAGEIEPLVQEKHLALSIAVPAALPRLRSDPLHVRQILLNLLGNAVKFTPAGGRLTVRAALVEARAGAPPFAPRPGHPRGAGGPAPQARPSVRDLFLLGRRPSAPDVIEPQGPSAVVPWIALQVVDTGVGIRADDQARIFDEFEQLGPRTGDGAERGTGLGLAISRRLAQLLGGDLTVESARGAGSTFTLWLPVDPVEAPAPADAATAAHGPRPPLAGERRTNEPRTGGRRVTDPDAEPRPIVSRA